MSSSEVWLEYLKELERRADMEPEDIEAKPAKEHKVKKTPEECREAKRARMREYQRERRANETPEEREARLARDREYQRKRYANMTPEEYEARLARNREWIRERRRKNKNS